MNWLRDLALAGIFISAGYYAATVAAAYRFRKRASAPPRPLPKIAPRAVLLKPLHGVNDSLADNLLSFMEVDYPRKEYVFGVSSYEDPAVHVPLAIKPRYQTSQITLTVGGDPSAANRKIGKLIRMVPRATRPDVFVLSDADIAVETDYLRRVIADLGGRLEALYINTDFMPMAILADTFEPLHYAFGATIAIKREVLEEIGGFEAIKDLLADDFHLGNRAVQHGYKIGLSSALVTIVPGERTFSDFWHHQLRWARTYRTVRPISLGTILTHGPFWAVLLVLSGGLSAGSIAIAAAAVAARLAMGAAMIKGLARLPLSLSDLGLLIVKDFCITGIWFASLLGNTVRWGQRQYRITADGRLEEIRSQAIQPAQEASQRQALSAMASPEISDASPGTR